MLIQCVKRLAAALLLYLVFLLVGAVVPFLFQPAVSRQTKKKFQEMAFCGSGDGGERAALLWDNGEALAERIRLITHARERVILSTFEFRADTAGRQVLAALLAAAERGVEVQVLADGVPALLRMRKNPYFHALSAQKKVQIRLYNRPRPWAPWRFMGRLHDKYLIVDETAYILGGQPGQKNYDWDVLVWSQGGTDSLLQLTGYFERLWDGGACTPFPSKAPSKIRRQVPKACGDLVQLYVRMQAERPEWFEPGYQGPRTVPVRKIRLLANPTTPYAKEPVVCYGMTELMSGGRQVSLHTPYVICNRWMLGRLRQVCGRAERVTLMTNSVANNGNPFGAMDYQAHRGELLDTGLHILEYDSGVSYHGKCAVIDDRLSLVGSFNYDMRSAYIDTELMLVLDSEAFCRTLREKMAEYEREAFPVNDAPAAMRSQCRAPQPIAPRKQRKLRWTRRLLGWARFLM